MKKFHVKKLCLEWLEGTMVPAKRRDVDKHLDECSQCKIYYQKMSILFEKPDPSHLPDLEPDRFLPARIRILNIPVQPSKYRIRVGWLNLSFYSVMIALAVTLGFYIGRGFSSTQKQFSDTELINAYYEAFSQEGFSDDLENLLEGEQEKL